MGTYWQYFKAQFFFSLFPDGGVICVLQSQPILILPILYCLEVDSNCSNYILCIGEINGRNNSNMDSFYNSISLSQLQSKAIFTFEFID